MKQLPKLREGEWCYRYVTDHGKWSGWKYAHSGCVLWLDGTETIEICDNRFNEAKTTMILPSVQSVRNAIAAGFAVSLIRRKRKGTPPPPRKKSLTIFD